ncbi:PEP-CTERM sorting domain-containing protein [Prosthecobacter vanneervenii]|uniref:Autotransporter-associated beta strand protein n=1 Tax=Prosthecobacter vanneervenii TaxID=48466 RepID=A0A7W8DM80_9BACT|nr:PEP-CTERM sorting domain-containing protein [Prosthecobacter vanneervenii]MBB5035103.1 autotransporter-associated beta strand protein [Prosthecobacter vanneervenii]
MKKNPRLEYGKLHLLISPLLAAACLAQTPVSAQSTFTTASGNQSWGTASNWSPSGVPNAVGASVIFNTPSGGNQAINSFGAVRTVGYMTINNDSANTFSITTTNTLTFDATSGNAALTVAGSGDNLSTFASSLSVVLNDSLDLSVTNTASSAADGALKISGAISGAGRIIKTGAGIMTLASSSNTFTGGVSILGGTVRISAGAALGAAPASYVPDQIIINGGTLEYTGSGVTSASNRGFALGSSTGTISVTGTGSYQIAGIVSDVTGQSGALRKTGSGTLYINPGSANTYSGGTTIVSGTLQIGIAGSLGTGTVNLGSTGGGNATLENTLGGYTFSNNINVISGSGGVLTLYYSGAAAFNSTFSGAISMGDNLVIRSDAISGQAMRITGAVSGAGSITKTGTGVLRLENNNASYTGITTISAGTLQIGNGSTTGGIGTGAIVNNSSLVVNRSNSLTLNNDMSGTGALVQAGTGTTTINNTNTYSGGTVVAKGTLQFGRTSSLGSGAVTLGSVGGGDATMENYLAGWITSNDISTVSGSGGTLTLSYTSSVTGFGSSVFSGALTLNDSIVIRSEAATGLAMRMQGAISGSGGITKTGAGVVRLENNNDGYSGTTTISAGTLQVGNNGSTGGLGSGNVVDNSALLITRSNSYTLANQISGTGTLTHSGSGITTLSNANTYSGGTNVTAGSLLVTNTTGSATGTGGVITSPGTALGGKGTIASTGSNSVVIGGAVSPGVPGENSGVGTLTFTPVDGTLSFQSGSAVVFELLASGSNDKIVFNATGAGVMDFSAMGAGGLIVSFSAGYIPQPGHSFDLIDWAAVSGTGISGLTESLLNLSTAGFDPSWRWDTSLFSTSGVISVVATVPEPSLGLMLMAGLMALALRRKRLRCVFE